MKKDCVVVVGSGMMGSGIGAMSALAGNKTILVDLDRLRADAGREKALACIALRLKNGLCTQEQAARAQTLISSCTNLEQAVSSAGLVIEAIVENLAAKQQLFQQLDALTDADVPLCSNTSGLRITEIAALCSNHPERTLTTHFWLPAHLVPLVEVVMWEKTDEAVASSVVQLLKGWKKSPVLVRRDLPGQLANRVFQAIIREAVDIVETGLASAEDVDTAIAAGMAMRFPVWGPLMHLDAIGTDLGLSVQQTVLPSISCSKEAGRYIKDLAARGDLGAKTGKGFYDWSKRSIADAMDKRDAFIIGACKLLDTLNG